VLSYSYNSSGVLSGATLKASDNALISTYNYNAQGLLKQIVFASNGNTQNYTYNSSGVLTTVTLNTSSTSGGTLGTLIQRHSKSPTENNATFTISKCHFTIGILVRSIVMATAPIRTAPNTMF
jgi:YD repeat-containing protein